MPKIDKHQKKKTWKRCETDFIRFKFTFASIHEFVSLQIHDYPEKKNLAFVI